MRGTGNRILERACFLQILNGQFKVGLKIGTVAGCFRHVQKVRPVWSPPIDSTTSRVTLPSRKSSPVFLPNTRLTANQRVIDQLKRNAQIFTVGFQRLNLGLGRAGEYAHFGGGGKQCGGFRLDNARNYPR